MKRLVILFILLALAGQPLYAQSKLENNFLKLSNEILENLQAFYPVRSTERGIHSYDYALADYSSKAVKSEISKLRGYEKRLRKYRGTNLSDELKIDYRLLKCEVDLALHDLQKLKIHTVNPYLYVDKAITGVYLLLMSGHAPLHERAQNIISRMKVTPDLLRQAKKNIKKPASIHIRLARETALNSHELYTDVKNELSANVPELAYEIETAANQAMAAMTDFIEFLDQVIPGENNAYALGKDDFDYKLQYQYFLDFDSDSLLKIGENMLHWADSMYDTYLAELDSKPAQNESVFVIDCVSGQDLLNYYTWEMEQVRLFIEQKGLMTVHGDIGECKIIETPLFLKNVITSIAYQPPGTFSSDQTGHFYVRSIPDSLDEGKREAYYRYIHRRGFKGSVVHEAFPGHHFQYQMASRHERDIRKWTNNMCFVEGWALYCEEMMYNNGLYGSNERQYLSVLRGIRFRAARIIADIKLHAHKIDPDEVLAWMADAVDSDTLSLRTEINWYSLQPTVPMSYLTGKLEIMALKEAVMSKEGDSFSLKQFHDRLLSEGSIPPVLFRDIWDLKE